MINVKAKGETRGRKLGIRRSSVARKARGERLWAWLTAFTLLAVTGLGGAISLAIAPAFSGSTVIAALVVFAVSAAMARSRLNAIEELEAEQAMHGRTTAGSDVDAEPVGTSR